MAKDKKKKLSKEEKKQMEAEAKKRREAEKQKMLSPFEIHTMPKKFNANVSQKEGGKSGKKKSGGALKMVLIVMTILIVLGILGFLAFMLYTNLNQPTEQPPTQQEEPAEEEPTEELPQEEEPMEEEPTEEEPIEEEPAEEEPVEEEPVEEEPQIQQPGTLQSSVDTDSDSLTDVEEELITTEIRVPDTDGDGFVDGQEVMNLYSPLSAGATSLSNLASINLYTNTNLEYTVLHPAAWLVLATDQSGREITFTATTGEMMTIEALENSNNVALSQWLIDNQPQVNPNTTTNYTTPQGFNSILTSNGLTYYINVPEQSTVYRFNYDPGNVSQLNFRTIFRMMVNSLTPQ